MGDTTEANGARISAEDALALHAAAPAGKLRPASPSR